MRLGPVGCASAERSGGDAVASPGNDCKGRVEQVEHIADGEQHARQDALHHQGRMRSLALHLFRQIDIALHGQAVQCGDVVGQHLGCHVHQQSVLGQARSGHQVQPVRQLAEVGLLKPEQRGNQQPTAPTPRARSTASWLTRTKKVPGGRWVNLGVCAAAGLGGIVGPRESPQGGPARVNSRGERPPNPRPRANRRLGTKPRSNRASSEVACPAEIRLPEKKKALKIKALIKVGGDEEDRISTTQIFT